MLSTLDFDVRLRGKYLDVPNKITRIESWQCDFTLYRNASLEKIHQNYGHNE